jgi:hypothetical protein
MNHSISQAFQNQGEFPFQVKHKWNVSLSILLQVNSKGPKFLPTYGSIVLNKTMVIICIFLEQGKEYRALFSDLRDILLTRTQSHGHNYMQENLGKEGRLFSLEKE